MHGSVSASGSNCCGQKTGAIHDGRNRGGLVNCQAVCRVHCRLRTILDLSDELEDRHARRTLDQTGSRISASSRSEVSHW
jgi:hypothetical protein